MKNIQSGTPAFVLTSLSLQKDAARSEQQYLNTDAAKNSSIIKFDYCLPPESLANNVSGNQPHAA